MTSLRALARIRYAFLTLLLECAIAALTLAAVVVAVPMMVILAAQLHGLATTGQWRGFQVAEFLDVLQIDASSLSSESSPPPESLLSLSASLVLFTAMLFFGLLAGILHRLNRRERAKFFSAQQNALLKDIERELETQ